MTRVSVATAVLRAQFHTHRLAPCRIETGQRYPGKARELVQRFPHLARVAAKGRHDVGLDRWIIRTGHIKFHTGWDDHAGDGAQIVALTRGE